MRLRTTRTVTAPTGAISLNGTTQYANKTSPAGMTFTDDFVVSAWVKPTSYSDSGIISRYNGTSGWILEFTATGQIRLSGFNGGAGNTSYVQSYQSLPLNKWTHVAAQLDMSTFTATTTTSYVMLDGVDVPATVTRAGTNPTALVQAGNLEIGTFNAGAFFPGNIAQVAIYNAKVTQANVRATISQTLSGSETSLISAYKLDQASGLTDLNTGNANNLTAQGSPTYSTDSPFSVDATGTPGGSYDYAIVQKIATTVATVSVPEGNTIPTSGGVSAVDLSAYKAPFGMPQQQERWTIEFILATSTTAAATLNTWYNSGSAKLTVPVGSFVLGYTGNFYAFAGGASSGGNSTNLSYTAANATPVTTRLTSHSNATSPGANTSLQYKLHVEDSVTLSAAAPVYVNVLSDTSIAGLGWLIYAAITNSRALTIFARCGYL